MQPAFSSTRQAAMFGLLLLILIALPALLGQSALPPRATIYTALPQRFGPFPFIHRQIFEEKGDIDIAFLGSSHVWSGIDMPYVEDALSARLGRKADVISLGWPYSGFDALYFIARDLLEHRKVRLLVIHDEFLGLGAPHRIVHRWFRYGDDPGTLEGLPFSSKASLYAGAALGMPRNFLAMHRDDLPLNDANPNLNFWQSFYHAPDPGTRLGTLSARLGYDYDPTFVAFVPPGDAQRSDAHFFGAAPSEDFRFGGRPTPPYQLHFARKLAELARSHGTRLAIIHMPVLGEASTTAIEEREYWPDTLQMPVDIFGIPQRVLFAGISEPDVRKLFFDPAHLNQNGQQFFTPRITPTLLRIYASKTENP